MGIRGSSVKVNNKELQRIIDNTTSREVTKLSNAGKQAMENIVSSGISGWYRHLLSESTGLAIRKSMEYRSTNVRQKNRFVYIDIIASVNMDTYQRYTEHYAINDYVKRHEDYDLVPHTFVFNLQWQQGILGLPERSSHTSWVNLNFIQGEPMYEYIANLIKKTFDKEMVKISRKLWR